MGYKCRECESYNKADYMFNEDVCMDCVSEEDIEQSDDAHARAESKYDLYRDLGLLD